MKLTFTVQSQPEKAEIFEGKKSLGQTPLVLTVTRGGYRTLSLRLEGYAPIEKTILGKSLSDTAKENIVRVGLTEAKTHAAAPAGGTPGSKTSAGKDVEKTEAAPASTQKAPIVKPPKGQTRLKRPAQKASAPTKKKVRPKATKSKKVKKGKKIKKQRKRKQAKKKKPDDDLVNPFD